MPIRRILLLIAIMLLPLLAACQAPPVVRAPWDQLTGPFFPRYASPGIKTLMENLVPGQSTRTEVFNLLGAPATISPATELAGGIRLAESPTLAPGTDQVWTYHLSEVGNRFPLDPRPLRLHTATASIQFDRQGRVLDYQVSELVR